MILLPVALSALHGDAGSKIRAEGTSCSKPTAFSAGPPAGAGAPLRAGLSTSASPRGLLRAGLCARASPRRGVRTGLSTRASARGGVRAGLPTPGCPRTAVRRPRRPQCLAAFAALREVLCPETAAEVVHRGGGGAWRRGAGPVTLEPGVRETPVSGEDAPESESGPPAPHRASGASRLWTPLRPTGGSVHGRFRSGPRALPAHRRPRNVPRALPAHGRFRPTDGPRAAGGK